MKRIIIICEGQTEQEFCNDILKPYFVKKGIYIQNPTIKKSKCGIVEWEVLKKQIYNHLKQDNGAIITLLIDYYGINEKHEFPKWREAKNIVDKSERMDFLENAMLEEINTDFQHRFIPYIQLHEFEGLLFSNQQVFDEYFEEIEFTNRNYLLGTFRTFDNPEDINDSKETAPSKRLCRAISGYNKVVHGSLIAGKIGLQTIRDKCPRFNNWVIRLENI